MVFILVLQAGDGRFGAVPTDEIDSDEGQVLFQIGPWAWAHGYLSRLGCGFAAFKVATAGEMPLSFSGIYLGCRFLGSLSIAYRFSRTVKERAAVVSL